MAKEMMSQTINPTQKTVDGIGKRRGFIFPILLLVNPLFLNLQSIHSQLAEENIIRGRQEDRADDETANLDHESHPARRLRLVSNLVFIQNENSLQNEPTGALPSRLPPPERKAQA
jgi:hypothetical protein